MKRYTHAAGAPRPITPDPFRTMAELRRGQRHGVEPVEQTGLDGCAVLVCSYCLYPVELMPEPAPTLGLLAEPMELFR